jgi:hypothetical protein
VPTDLPQERADDALAAEFARDVLLDPHRIHGLASALLCGNAERERNAARACVRIARERSSLLEPIMRRLVRVANATEDD